MSKVKIEGNASGTGTLTISAPNTNTDRTLTLPDGAGEIITSSTIGSNMPSGSVLQVVQGTTSTQVVVTTGSYTDTGLTASITPTSASSKILVLVSQNVFLARETDGRIAVRHRLLRDATQVFEDENATAFIGGLNSLSEVRIGSRLSINYLDSPSTTSTITYKTQGYPSYTTNNGTAYFQISNAGDSNIVLMEISG